MEQGPSDSIKLRLPLLCGHAGCIFTSGLNEISAACLTRHLSSTLKCIRLFLQAEMHEKLFISNHHKLDSFFFY